MGKAASGGERRFPASPAAEGSAALADGSYREALSSVTIKTELLSHLHVIKMKTPLQTTFSFPPPRRAGKLIKQRKIALLRTVRSFIMTFQLRFNSCDISEYSSKISITYTNPPAIMVNKRNTIPREMTCEVRLSVPILTDKRS